MSQKTQNKYCGQGLGSCASQAIPRPSLQDRPQESALLHQLLRDMPDPDAKVEGLALGSRFLAVRTGRGMGLASTLGARATKQDSASLAGLKDGSLGEYAALLLSESPFLASVGLAALNAGYPPPTGAPALPAGDLFNSLCQGQKVAVVGDFPFVRDLRSIAASLTVLDLRPGRGDEPVPDLAAALKDCQVAAISATTLLTRALRQMLDAAPKALKVLVGPSTPWAPLLLEAGVDALAGSAVTDLDAVFEAVAQDLPFREIKKRGVRLSIWSRPGVIPE